MSNRLTFSLASLFLIFTLTFAAMPVMAAAGGPTVTFAEYAGKENPAIDPGTQDDHVQERGDFRVKLTFSHPVSTPTNSNVQFRTVTPAGTLGNSQNVDNISTVYSQIDQGNVSTTMFVATVYSSAPDASITGVLVSIDDDVVTGSTTANPKKNVGSSKEFTLPALNPTITAELGTPKPSNTPGEFTIGVTFDNGTADDDTPNALSLTQAFTTSYVTVKPVGSAAVTAVGPLVVGSAAEDTPKVGKATSSITVRLNYGAEVKVSIPAGYLKSGSNEVAVPPEAAAPALVTKDIKKEPDKTGAIVVTLPFDKAFATGTMPSVKDPSAPAAGAKDTRTYTVSDVTKHATMEDTYMVTVTPMVAQAAKIPAETVTLKVAGEDVTVEIPERGTSELVTIPTATSSSDKIQVPALTIPAWGFAVLVRDFAGSGTLDPTISPNWVRAAMDLPNLEWFLGGVGGTNGGTITLHSVDPKDATKKGPTGVYISEIMWGTDYSLADPRTSQWIELYNHTNAPIDLGCFYLWFHGDLVRETTWDIFDHVDTVSNAGITDPNPAYKYHSPWALSDKGKSGRTSATDTPQAYNYADPTTLISMYREINFTDKTSTIPSGAAEGSWSASVYPTANFYSRRIGTPGAETIVRITFAETSVSQALLINEIGNSTNDAYDWVEIHNPGTANVNIKNMMFTTVTNTGTDAAPVGTEKILFRFPDADLNIKPGHFVVFAASDPKNDGNDLAAGIDITKSDPDQPNKGLGSHLGKDGMADVPDVDNPHPFDNDNTTAFYRIHSALNLPNEDVKRLYILRASKDKNKDSAYIGAHPDAQNNVVDVIGSLALPLNNETPSTWTGGKPVETGRTDTAVASTRRIFNTTTWPLQWAKAPKPKMVDDGAPALAPGKVYQRNGKKLPKDPDENHLTTAGYTGIGYDRHASVNGENGGTPGYANNAVKAKASDLAGKITISEIMLATEEDTTQGRVPRATRLPQWIEIYNSSLEHSVNLKNWYIEIQNADSPDLPATRNLSETVRLTARDVYVQPNQTVLITTGSGINSGNFPSHRLINLYTTGAYRNALNLKDRGDPALSQVGFWIQLRDVDNKVVDTIGNLAVSRRTGLTPQRRDNFDTAWDLPSLSDENGHRVSFIRIYDDKTGEANDGLKPVADPAIGKDPSNFGWRSAADVNFNTVPNVTYYGNQEDRGTPGYRGGGPLPVSLSKFRPERRKETGEVVIRWITESETNNAGFNILRSDTRNGEYTKLNTQLIAGQGTTSERTTYEWKDTSAKPNVAYYYQIQDVSLDGRVTPLRVNRLKGHVNAAGKATTTWGELKALQ